MANLPARGFAVLALLAVGCAAMASCTSFSASPSDAPDAGSDGATTPVDSGLDAPIDPAGDAAVDANAEAGLPALDCTGATFCETFDMGDLSAIEMRWGMLERSSGCSGCVAAIVEESPFRRFLQATTSTPGTYARLTHPLGATTPAIHINLRFDFRLSTKGTYEIVVFNLYDQSNVLSGDLAVKAMPSGTLALAWSANNGAYTTKETAQKFANGGWHTATLEATAAAATLTVDGASMVVNTSPFQQSWPMARFSAGAYFGDGAPPVIATDDIRLDLLP